MHIVRVAFGQCEMREERTQAVHRNWKATSSICTTRACAPDEVGACAPEEVGAEVGFAACAAKVGAIVAEVCEV